MTHLLHMPSTPEAASPNPRDRLGGPKLSNSVCRAKRGGKAQVESCEFSPWGKIIIIRE
jgi:hypothetical protein